MIASPLYTLWPDGPTLDLDSLCAVVPGTTNSLLTLYMTGNTLTVPVGSVNLPGLLWSWNCWRIRTDRTTGQRPAWE